MGKYRGFYPPRVLEKLPFYESPCGFMSISRTLRAGGPLRHLQHHVPNLPASDSAGKAAGVGGCQEQAGQGEEMKWGSDHQTRSLEPPL